MTSPYGGDRGGGKKPTRKPGGQPGNVNRRASLLLPKAKDTADRRAFLDALEEAQQIPLAEKTRALVDLVYARVVSLSEQIGVQRIIKALLALDIHAKTRHRLSGHEQAVARERLKDAALSEIWKGVGECERCAAQVDQILRGLELSLKQTGVQDGVAE